MKTAWSSWKGFQLKLVVVSLKCDSFGLIHTVRNYRNGVGMGVMAYSHTWIQIQVQTPIQMDSLMIGLWLQLLNEEISTLHTKGEASPSLNDYLLYAFSGQGPFPGQGSNPSPCVWKSHGQVSIVSDILSVSSWTWTKFWSSFSLSVNRPIFAMLLLIYRDGYFVCVLPAPLLPLVAKITKLVTRVDLTLPILLATILATQ